MNFQIFHDIHSLNVFHQNVAHCFSGEEVIVKYSYHIDMIDSM
jgi:hypothetical protein